MLFVKALWFGLYVAPNLPLDIPFYYLDNKTILVEI